VREDIADALKRMGPFRDPETGVPKFSGWARMALPVAPGALAVTEVRKPNVGRDSWIVHSLSPRPQRSFRTLVS